MVRNANQMEGRVVLRIGRWVANELKLSPTQIGLIAFAIMVVQVWKPQRSSPLIVSEHPGIATGTRYGRF